MSFSYRLLAHSTLPPGTALEQGITVRKVWQIQNNGTDTWDHFLVEHIKGRVDPIATPIRLPSTGPGEMVEVVVSGKVPAERGRFSATWGIRTPDGDPVGSPLTIEIETIESGQPNGMLQNYRTNETPQAGNLPDQSPFIHTLLLENSGGRPWQAGDQLVYLGGDMIPKRRVIDLPHINPGFREPLAVKMQPAPNFKGGIGTAYWQFRSFLGLPFGEIVAPEASFPTPVFNIIPPDGTGPDTDKPFEPARWRSVIFAITSVFESSGNPAALQTEDLGIVSFGKHQATLQSGNLEKVLGRYFQLSSSTVSRELEQSFFARVRSKDPQLRHNARFLDLLRASAAEAAMVQAQEDVFAADFYDPAVTQAGQLGLRTPLGLACLYDNRIQGGVLTVTGRTKRRMGGTPLDGIAEKSWIEGMLIERQNWLLEIADQKAAQGATRDAELLRTSTFRVVALRQILEENNLNLTGTFKVRSVTIEGLPQ